MDPSFSSSHIDPRDQNNHQQGSGWRAININPDPLNAMVGSKDHPFLGATPTSQALQGIQPGMVATAPHRPLERCPVFSCLNPASFLSRRQSDRGLWHEPYAHAASQSRSNVSDPACRSSVRGCERDLHVHQQGYVEHFSVPRNSILTHWEGTTSYIKYVLEVASLLSLRDTASKLAQYPQTIVLWNLNI